MITAAAVTVVVVTWQGRHLLGPCLASLSGQEVAHRTLVIDNASTDGTTDYVTTDHPGVRVLRLARNTGFAGGVAAALPEIDTRYLALLNNDAVAEPGWLRAATAYLDAHTDTAAVTSRMLLAHPAGHVNNAGVVLLRSGYGADRGLGDPDGERYAMPAEVFGASGGAAVFRTLAVKAVGGIESGFFLYYEDTDLSWRLRLAGWRIVYCPEAVVTHRHAASSDPSSERFAFYNERNRLLTLTRCAPLPFLALALARFGATTLSLATKRLLRRPVPDEPVFDLGLRLRVVLSSLRLAPAVLGVRASASAPARRRVLRQWRGVSERYEL